MNNHNTPNTENDALAKAAALRKSTQVPNATSSTHEIHGDIGFGGNASDTGSIPVSGI